MRKWYVVFITVLLATTVSAASVDYTKMFAHANELYEKKEYDSTIAAYREILTHGVESAPLYFNLGNAYFKSGDLGHAILYYLKARRLEPADEDILSNLEFARQFSRVQMEGVELNPINSFLSSLVAPYRVNTLLWVTSAFFVLFMLFLILRWGLGMNTVWVRMGIIIPLLFLFLSASLTAFKYRTDFLTKRAVIVADEAPVYTGPSEQSDLELQGAPGLIVEILAESGDYYNVLFENKRRGWIKKDLVAVV